MQGKASFTLSPQDLQKYVADFEFEGITATATTTIKDNALMASVPGQGDFELVPVSPDTFRIKGMEGYKVHFEMEGNKLLGFTSTQPDGTYKAHIKQ